MKDQKVPPTDTTLSKRLRRGDTVYIKYEYDRYYVPGKKYIPSESDDRKAVCR